MTRERDRTRFLLEDLNGAFFTLVGRGSTAASRAAAVARVRRALSGTRWMSRIADDVWEYIQRDVDETSTAFGPAAVLLTVEPDNPRVTTWIAALSPSVRRALVMCLEGSPAPRNEKRPHAVTTG